MDFVSVLGSISLTNPSWDLFVLVAFLAGIYLYVFRYGKDRAFLVLISGYLSLFLVGKLSLVKAVTGLGIEETFNNKAILFLGLVAILSWVLSHSDFMSVFSRSGKKDWFQVLVISFLQIGFLASAVISFVPVTQVGSLSIFLNTFFASAQAQLFWLITPFFAIALIKGK